MVVDLSGGGLPKYHRLANQLRAMIGADFQPGDRIPSESQLIERFGVSHLTIRHAIDVLRAEGLLVSHHGRGVFVKGSPTLRLISRNPYARDQGGDEPRVMKLIHQITFAGEAPVPDGIADLMAVQPGSSAFVRHRTLYLQPERAVEVGTTYLPIEAGCGELLELRPTDRPLFLVVEELTGRRYTRAEDRIVARMPSAEEAVLMSIGPGIPVMRRLHTAHAEDGGVIEVSESAWPADQAMVYDDYDIS